jgi:hypothetical protein
VGPSLAQAFAQVRTELEASIGKAGAALAASADYEPYRRHYVAQQRDMEARVGPLRALLREALAQAAPAQRQLAALDAAFDGILAGREARLLASLPLLLKQRFTHLQQAHAAQAGRVPSDDRAATGLPPGNWLSRFGRELQTVLLAELDLRLQPALGLLEAFENEKTQQP